MIHQDGAELDDLLLHLSELSEAMEKDGKLPEHALSKRPVLAWAEGELGSSSSTAAGASSATSTAAPSASGSPAATSSSSSLASSSTAQQQQQQRQGSSSTSVADSTSGPRSLAHRVGVAATALSSSSSVGPAGTRHALLSSRSVLVFDVTDPRLLDDDAAPMRPGGRLRLPPWGRGSITFIRCAAAPAPRSVPPSTPLALTVIGVGVRLDWVADAVMRPDGVRCAPPNDGVVSRDNLHMCADADEAARGPRNGSRRRDGGGGGGSSRHARGGGQQIAARSSGQGRARGSRITDAIEDADAALARKLQSEEIIEAMAEEGEDVDRASLMYDAHGLSMIRDALNSHMPSLRAGASVEDEVRDEALPFMPHTLFIPAGLLRALASGAVSPGPPAAALPCGTQGSVAEWLSSGGRAATAATAAGSGSAPESASGLPARGLGRISVMQPVEAEARAEAAMRLCVENTVFDKASVRAADPDVVQSLPLRKSSGPMVTTRHAGGNSSGRASTSTSGNECVICRDEFEAGDVLRVLPCGHGEWWCAKGCRPCHVHEIKTARGYTLPPCRHCCCPYSCLPCLPSACVRAEWHARCCDPWLLTDGRCPLCLAPITAAKGKGKAAQR